jgi:hypothetical protein
VQLPFSVGGKVGSGVETGGLLCYRATMSEGNPIRKGLGLDGLTREEQLERLVEMEELINYCWDHMNPFAAREIVGSRHNGLGTIKTMRKRIMAGLPPEGSTPEERADDDAFWAGVDARLAEPITAPAHRPYEPE